MWHAYQQGDGNTGRKTGPPNEALGRPGKAQGTIKTLDSHIMCEVYGNTGHSGTDCPETHEEAMFMNNGYRPQGGHG